jgi:hypothetical protein
MTQPASLVIRTVALLTDALFLGIGWAALAIAFENHLNVNAHFEGSLVYWLAYVTFLAYTSTEFTLGSSPAQRIYGLRTTGPSGQPPTMVRRAVRWFVKHFPFHFTVIVWAVGDDGPVVPLSLLTLALPACSMIMLVCRSRRTIHDAVSGLSLFGRAPAQGFPAIPLGSIAQPHA